MPRYLTKKKRLEKIEIGSLNSGITIFLRELISPAGNDYKYREVFTPKRNVWAFIDTVEGITVFDDVNTERVITHDFYIYYIKNITFQNWLEYKGNRYRIYHVENYGLENKFYLLRTTLTGDKDKQVSLA
jgi:SPP1 family predicted phage head-tail adaptor